MNAHAKLCPPDCGHTPEEHTAFDLGVMAGRAGADPEANPYPVAVNPCGEWWAWGYGHSAGDCERDNGPPIGVDLYEAWNDIHRQLTEQGFALTRGPFDGVACRVVVVQCGELLMGYSRPEAKPAGILMRVRALGCATSDQPACKEQEPEDFGARDEARMSWGATKARHQFKIPTYSTRPPRRAHTHRNHRR
jgi:hypothetical protein